MVNPVVDGCFANLRILRTLFLLGSRSGVGSVLEPPAGFVAGIDFVKIRLLPHLQLIGQRLTGCYGRVPLRKYVDKRIIFVWSFRAWSAFCHYALAPDGATFALLVTRRMNLPNSASARAA